MCVCVCCMVGTRWYTCHVCVYTHVHVCGTYMWYTIHVLHVMCAHIHDIHYSHSRVTHTWKENMFFREQRELVLYSFLNIAAVHMYQIYQLSIQPNSMYMCTCTHTCTYIHVYIIYIYHGDGILKFIYFILCIFKKK